MELDYLISHPEAPLSFWPMVREGTLDQEKNPPETLLWGCSGGGHGEPGWKDNQRDEFRFGNDPS